MSTTRTLKVKSINEIEGSWGEFSYLREFIIRGPRCKKRDVNGWIVQSINRKANVRDRNGNIYNSDEAIRELTSHHVLGAVDEYVEFFRVKDGNIIDETTNNLIDDRFQGGQIKKYEGNETTVEEEDDTGGVLTIESKAYFIDNIVDDIDMDEIIRGIGANVDSANGLISSYGFSDYYELLRYRSSNIWCSNIKVSWTIPDEDTSDDDAGTNTFTFNEYKCDKTTGGKKYKTKKNKSKINKTRKNKKRRTNIK